MGDRIHTPSDDDVSGYRDQLGSPALAVRLELGRYDDHGSMVPGSSPSDHISGGRKPDAVVDAYRRSWVSTALLSVRRDEPRPCCGSSIRTLAGAPVEAVPEHSGRLERTRLADGRPCPWTAHMGEKRLLRGAYAAFASRYEDPATPLTQMAPCAWEDDRDEV